MIRLADVHKTYNAKEIDVPVLKGIDLHIKKGEYVAIMGRSGAGKSTLMNILGCLDRPSRGQYCFDGEDISTLDDDALSVIRGKRIGFVFQSFHLLKGMTVLENVELPLEYQRISGQKRKQRATYLVERVGLTHRRGHFPNQLSGGERQRVAIARSLACDPQVLLADEPTGNLDLKAQSAVLTLLEEIRDDFGLTIVMVTHDPLLGETAQRCIIVSDGRVVDNENGGIH